MAAQTKRPTMMQATRASITALAPEKRGAVPVQVGDAVEVGEHKLTGVVRFSGTTKFAEGEWLGIELDKKAGKNNGSVRGDVYFQCAPDHGIFVRPTAVVKRGDVTSPSAPVVKASENAGAETLTVPKVEAKSARDSNASKASAEEAVASDRAKAQLDLAMAMEDHDIHRIKHFLPVAKNLGVAPEEINAARKILEYETLVIAAEDVKRLNSSLAELKNRVEDLQKTAQAKRAMPPAVLQELERRLYNSIEVKVTKFLEGRVAALTAKAALAEQQMRQRVQDQIVAAAADGRLEVALRQQQASTSVPMPAAVSEAGKQEEIFTGAGRKLTEASKDEGQTAAPAKSAEEAESPMKDVVRCTLFAVFSGASRKLLEEERFQVGKAPEKDEGKDALRAATSTGVYSGAARGLTEASEDEGKAAKPAAKSAVPAETLHKDIVRSTLFAVYSSASRKLPQDAVQTLPAVPAVPAAGSKPEAPNETGRGKAAQPATSAVAGETPHNEVVRSTLFAAYSAASRKLSEAPSEDAGKVPKPPATSTVAAETPHDEVVRSTLSAVYSAAARKPP